MGVVDHHIGRRDFHFVPQFPIYMFVGLDANDELYESKTSLNIHTIW